MHRAFAVPIIEGGRIRSTEARPGPHAARHASVVRADACFASAEVGQGLGDEVAGGASVYGGTVEQGERLGVQGKLSRLGDG
jgi:hypothetical protein